MGPEGPLPDPRVITGREKGPLQGSRQRACLPRGCQTHIVSDFLKTTTFLPFPGLEVPPFSSAEGRSPGGPGCRAGSCRHEVGWPGLVGAAALLCWGHVGCSLVAVSHRLRDQDSDVCVTSSGLHVLALNPATHQGPQFAASWLHSSYPGVPVTALYVRP